MQCSERSEGAAFVVFMYCKTLTSGPALACRRRRHISVGLPLSEVLWSCEGEKRGFVRGTCHTRLGLLFMQKKRKTLLPQNVS